MEDVNDQLASIRTILADHIVANNKKFSEYDSLVSQLTGMMGMSPVASAPTKTGVVSKETEMAGMTDNVTVNATDPAMAMMAPMMAAMSNKGGDGFLGGGGGLVGGLLLGSLLRNNGGLFGGNGNGAGAMTDVTQPGANMSIMSTLGDIKQAVAVGTAQMETSQALQSSTIQAQLNSVTASLANRVDGVKDVVNTNSIALMQMLNQTNTNITNDGEKTRALITSQYEQTLNRQLAEANNALIELRNEGRQRNSEINITTQVNQMQQQQQQQNQIANLQNLLLDAVQSIRATNQAINIGAGTLTANPTNTNTNTRVN